MTKKSGITIEQWTDILNSYQRNPILKAPFHKQRNLISYLFAPSQNIKLVDLCCGRGFGKSFLAVFIATMTLQLAEGMYVLFLEPDWKRVRRVFLQKWRQIVPKELYILNKTESFIFWRPTNSHLYFGPRNITGSYEAADDANLGFDIHAIIDDEAAQRCSMSMYLNNLATIRAPGNVRYYLTLSTPRLGSYKDLIESDNHILFRGTSRDNPHLPPGYVEQLADEYSNEQYQRDILGQFVSLEGRIWKDFVFEDYPKGNMIDCAHDHNKPFLVGVDVGLRSGWGIYQWAGRSMQSPLVLTAEYTPTVGDTAKMAERITADYGIPARVVTGGDVETGSSQDNTTHVDIFGAKGWRRSVIVPIRGRMRSKERQYYAASRAICDWKGNRRFCISKQLKTHDEKKNKKRGLLQVMLEDEWPQEHDHRWASDFLPKDKRGGGKGLEDARDQFLYVCADIWPPRRDDVDFNVRELNAS